MEIILTIVVFLSAVASVVVATLVVPKLREALELLREVLDICRKLVGPARALMTEDQAVREGWALAEQMDRLAVKEGRSRMGSDTKRRVAIDYARESCSIGKVATSDARLRQKLEAVHSELVKK